MARGIENRINKLEEERGKRDRPEPTRLIFYEDEPITDEAYQCASPVLIWDIDKFEDDGREVGV